MPIWVYHGAKDEVVPLSRSEEMVDALNDAEPMYDSPSILRSIMTHGPDASCNGRTVRLDSVAEEILGPGCQQHQHLEMDGRCSRCSPSC